MLARAFFPGGAYASLEDPDVREFAEEERSDDCIQGRTGFELRD
jgi:hypothetical protein